jgi:hypothetical protein
LRSETFGDGQRLCIYRHESEQPPQHLARTAPRAQQARPARIRSARCGRARAECRPGRRARAERRRSAGRGVICLRLRLDLPRARLHDGRLPALPSCPGLVARARLSARARSTTPPTLALCAQPGAAPHALCSAHASRRRARAERGARPPLAPYSCAALTSSFSWLTIVCLADRPACSAPEPRVALSVSLACSSKASGDCLPELWL